MTAKSREVTDAALELLGRLKDFRELMTLTETPPPYRTPEYDDGYGPVLTARETFIEVAGRDLKP